MTGSYWTAERVETLKRLWFAGLSCSQIAERIGHVSRNAVIGKIARLGLSNSQRHRNTYGANLRSARTRKRRADILRVSRAKPKEKPPQRPWLADVAPLPPKAVTDVARKPLADLEDQDCRWPVGDPKAKDFGFCAAERVPGMAYCAAHCARAYQAPQPRRSGDREAEAAHAAPGMNPTLQEA